LDANADADERRHTNLARDDGNGTALLAQGGSDQQEDGSPGSREELFL
jgi:hypothetical protein